MKKLSKIKHKKVLIFLVLLNSIMQETRSQATKIENKQDTITTVIDSLSFTYNPSKLTILVNDKLVHYSVVFNIEKQVVNPGYKYVQGNMNPFEAIKKYGEKYRNGILAYKKESEENNE